MRNTQVSLLALIGCVTAVYVFSCPRVILGGDSAEFVTLHAIGGIAHPPGYPLYVLWLRLTHALAGAWLPPAYLASLATALLGVGSVALLFKAALAHGASARAATLGAFAFAFAPIAWRLNTQPEVFAPHVLLCAALVYLCAAEGPFRGGQRVFAVSVVGGAALSVHHTAVLLGPTVVYGLVCGVREMQRRSHAAPLILAGGLLGLSPYLTLFYPPGDGFVWRRITSWHDLAEHFLRAEYGTFQLSPHEEAPRPLAQVGAFVQRIGRELLVIPLALALYAMATRARDVNKLTLLGSFLLAGPLFAALLNIPPYGPGQLFVPRFYMLPLWLVCLWIALGADRLGRYLQPASLLLAAALVLIGWPAVQAEHRPTVEYWLRNALSVLPDDAVVLIEGDHRAFALEYAQRVERQKPGVLALRLNVLSKERDRVAAALGRDVLDEDLSADVLMQRLMEVPRPVYVTLGIAADLMSKYPFVPEAPFYRLLKKGEPPPSLESLTLLNRERMTRFRFEEASEDSSPSWATLTLFDYSEPWVWLAKRWQARGDDAQVLACMEEVAKIAPWLAEAAVDKVAKAKR